MTIDTALIEKESRKLYLQYLKNPAIPEDLCSEIFLEFTKRMEKERTRGDGRISGKGIGQLIKIATRTVFHKHKKQEEKEAILTNIVNRNASQYWSKNRPPEEKAFFDKIALFLKDWVKEKKQRPRYLRVFLLYHVYHLGPDYLEDLGACTDLPLKEFLVQAEEIRESVRERMNEKLENKVKSLGTEYFHKISKQTRCGGLYITQFEGGEEHYQLVEGNRKQAKKVIKELQFTPTWAQISRTTGISERMAAYAGQAAIKAIKNSFRDDSYWQ